MVFSLMSLPLSEEFCVGTPTSQQSILSDFRHPKAFLYKRAKGVCRRRRQGVGVLCFAPVVGLPHF